MLCLVVQSCIIPENELDYDVAECKWQCQKCKNNIIGKSTGHHQSRGSVFGYGSHREFKIDEVTHSSVGLYKTHEHFKHFATTLQGRLIRSMEYVPDSLKGFIGYDLLLDNSVSLRVSEKQARIKGISKDFHLQGATCYTSLFYNVNASTLDKHIELDWSMTTIFVPQQKWVGKEKNHLQFIFHLTGKKNGMLHVSMSPGMIIYFHGSLLTHQQVHNCGEVTGSGCCLNFSAYANRALLCNFITTINRIKQKKKNN